MRVVHDLGQPSTPADPASFTGRVWRTDYLAATDGSALAGLRFWYEPGARSWWHQHDGAQVIVGVSGHGLVGWEGLDGTALLGPGDWWEVTPGVPHWHGATAESTFAHLAVTGPGGTHWIREVTREEYAAGVGLGA